MFGDKNLQPATADRFPQFAFQLCAIPFQLPLNNSLSHANEVEMFFLSIVVCHFFDDRRMKRDDRISALLMRSMNSLLRRLGGASGTLAVATLVDTEVAHTGAQE